MICANCRRPIKHAAAEVGRMKFGPTCARSLGLIDRHGRIVVTPGRLPIERDPLTLDLFDHQDQETIAK